MTNPVARETTSLNYTGGEKLYRSVMTYCPGCKMAHPFRVELYPACEPRADGSNYPVWEWDGKLDPPTFSPSMLCYSSVHICEEAHPPVPCENYDTCETTGHLIVNYNEAPKEEWIYAHTTPHTQDPAFGNCHSFLKNGVWEFLSDSAHELAGQNVPMVPLPDWLMGIEAE